MPRGCRRARPVNVLAAAWLSWTLARLSGHSPLRIAIDASQPSVWRKNKKFLTNKSNRSNTCNVKLIELTQGQVTKVDDADFEFLSQWKWKAKRKPGKRWYAVRFRYAGYKPGGKEKKKQIGMANLIMNAPPGQIVDHENGDTLDNQRVNLRFASNAQNQHNQRKLRSDNTSGYKGVFWDNHLRKFVAQIYLNMKPKKIGFFDTAKEAALAYDQAAREHFGEFAAPNSVLGTV
jgi:hypothetical protein